MKLPDRLVLKWLARHPKFDQFLEKHFSYLILFSFLIFEIGISASHYALEQNWLMVSNMTDWISALGFSLYLVLPCAWFLKHATQQEVDQLRNKEQNDAHP